MNYEPMIRRAVEEQDLNLDNLCRIADLEDALEASFNLKNPAITVSTDDSGRLVAIIHFVPSFVVDYCVDQFGGTRITDFDVFVCI